ncbi:MAG TPA: efflux RND transporter periplasmic adaptor subunit [Candidatus Saccharimonadales bacterium]|nr:efflux RND transporter periplasmic adaptor subunit [Candidatus Saccharimonadales bacterium]
MNSLRFERPRLGRVVLSLSICGLGLGMASGCTGKSQAEKITRPVEIAIPVTTVRAELRSLDKAIPVSGTLFAKDEATLSAEVEGRVEKTLVEFGDQVKSGQELASINTTTYEAQAQQAAATLARTKASALNAEHELKRVQELIKSSIAAESELDKAKADSEQARAEVQGAEAMATLARLNLERSHVRAPFDAAVAERIANGGDFMKVGSPLFRVVNDKTLKYIVHAPERYAGEVKRDQTVLFSVDSWPGRIFEGKVYLISPSINTTTRSFALGALVPNADRTLKANSFARGELILQRSRPTLMIPLDAVQNFAGVSKVFLLENGVGRSREVQVGRIKEGQQEILSGLKEGEIIITSGFTKLFDGAKVRVKDVTDGKST